MKEKKKIDKTKTKEIIKKVFHVVGYVSIGAWVLFGLLVGCSYATQGVRAQDKQETRELAKLNAPINNVVYDYYYDINDIHDVYASNLTSTDVGFYYTNYVLQDDLYVSNFYNNGVGLSGSITPYTLFNTMATSLNYDYSYLPNTYEYDLIFYLLNPIPQDTLINSYARIGNHRIDLIRFHTFSYNNEIFYNLSIELTTLPYNSRWSIDLGNSNASSDYLFFCSSPDIAQFVLKVFNSGFYFGKILEETAVPQYYERFIYLFNDKAPRNIYAHTQFEFDSLSWLSLYFNQAKINSLYGGYVLSFSNTQLSTDLIFDVLYGDFRLNGAYYHQLRLVYALVPTSYSGIRLQDAYGNTDDFVLRSNNRYIRYLKYIDLYNSNNGRSEHLCDFKYDVLNAVDNSGSTTIYEDWIVYSKDFTSSNNREFLIRALVPYNVINLDSQQTNYEYFDTTMLQNTNYSLFDGALNYLSITHESINYHDYSNFVDTEGVRWIQNSFTLISLGFEGIWGFLGIYILPGITIGTLILTPLLITMFLILLRIFKAH